jgi:16S rRNA (guanine527-N7)-methyltransferase
MPCDPGVGPSGASGGDEAARIAASIGAYRALLHRYHRTLDLMSDAGLAGLDAKLDDARAYARAVATWAEPGCVLDVGSGAGLPGVVVAAELPERSMVWAERRRRRATFLGMVAASCGLANVSVVEGDVRRLSLDGLPAPLAAVTAQAVAGWSELYAWTRHLHGDRVVLIARRGEGWAGEAAVFAESIGGAARVLATEPLGRGGTLVVLRVGGGSACR